MREFVLTAPGLPEKGTVYRRVAARGIIRREGRLLLVHTDAGDYKFPGGGVEEGESLEAALAREIREETGRALRGGVRPYGLVRERRRGRTADILEMDSHYYFCQVEDQAAPLRLDHYEAEEHFQPVWATLEEALAANRAIPGATPWVDREILVMEALLQDREI